MKFLVLQHVPHEHPGLISAWAEQRGVGLTIVGMWKPYRRPKAGDFDAVIILGGPMAVYEEFPSKNDELAFIKDALDKDKHILGFCLGAQLLANALGAKVYPNEKNGRPVKEIGYYDIRLTDFGTEDPLFKNFQPAIKVLQWHGDTFDLPERGILLASSDDCKNQAFKCHKSYGVQFHMEFTPQMVEKLILEDREWIYKDYQLDDEQLKQQSKAYEELMAKQCNLLMDNFIATIQ
ncbi:MAG: type 1 glutamine amidotransferase [Candidatus Doudnabacteria bacterium]|nr:type 1 glutamine amidotransferase [Candidatus Doudnabacteria bacterium]